MRSRDRGLESLHGYRSFAETISRGSSCFVRPIRCYFSLLGTSPSIRVGFTVSKSIRNSSQRNLIRRRLREGYRANRVAFLESLSQSGSGMNIVFLYVGKPSIVKKEANFQAIHEAFRSILPKIASVATNDAR